MLVAVDRELRLATHSGKCDMEEIIAINSSYALLKSQLWDRKCEGVTENTGTCQPLAALDYLIQNIDFALPDCGSVFYLCIIKLCILIYMLTYEAHLGIYNELVMFSFFDYRG